MKTTVKEKYARSYNKLKKHEKKSNSISPTNTENERRKLKNTDQKTLLSPIKHYLEQR